MQPMKVSLVEEASQMRPQFASAANQWPGRMGNLASLGGATILKFWSVIILMILTTEIPLLFMLA